MKIAIIGGTGRERAGLALRWAAAGEDVVIGSRDEKRAAAAADHLNRMLGKAAARGTSNRRAVEEADVVVLTVPYAAHLATLQEVKEAVRGKLLIDTTVPLDPEAPGRLASANNRSALEQAQEFLGSETKVVAAFQNISYRLLKDPKRAIDSDVLVCGDDPNAKRSAMALVEKAGLRAIDAGGAHHARAVEGLTPLLLELNRRYRTQEAGIRITGLPEKER
ncbi:MAG: NADPH-dependent F420 reductase [candidate division NC10 bacterium]|nr:NADPH-dependent F420 reductase [candidate division NC10 bacterium]